MIINTNLRDSECQDPTAKKHPHLVISDSGVTMDQSTITRMIDEWLKEGALKKAMDMTTKILDQAKDNPELLRPTAMAKIVQAVFDMAQKRMGQEEPEKLRFEFSVKDLPNDPGQLQVARARLLERRKALSGN